MTRVRMAAAATLAIVSAIACGRKPKPVVHVLTTREIAATGLVQRVAEAFTRDGGSSLIVTAVASPDLMAVLQKGQGDVAIINDPAVLQKLTDSNLTRLSSPMMRERFAIAGPSRDPARVKRAGSTAEAMRLIVEKKRPFCSPVDVPRLRRRELLLWPAAGVDPKTDSRYRECKGTAAAVLHDAARGQAYTITDRDTFDAAHERGISILRENEPLLNNDDVVVLLRREKQNRDAEWFVEWSMSARAREVVHTYETSR